MRLPVVRRSDRARDAGPRSTHRSSVLVYLVALTIVPSIGLPVLAGFFTQDRLADARAAGRIGDKMTLVSELHDLQSSVAFESSATVIRSTASRFGLTVDELAGIIGSDVIIPVGTARGRTDALLADFRPDSAARPAIQQLRDRLDALRRSADRSFGEGTGASANAWELTLEFTELDLMLSETKQATIQRIVDGDAGPGSNELLTAVSELEHVTVTVDVGNERHALVAGLITADTDAQHATTAATLRETSALWHRLSADLTDQLHGATLRSWSTSIARADAASLDDNITAMTEEGILTDQVLPSVASQEAGVSAARLSKDLRTLINDVADEGVAIADADEAEAERRGRLAMAGTAILLLVTTALLVMIGGFLRRRLGGLAEAAERFSAGRFDEMPVHGPREIAVASAALNDAVVSFRQVSVQAERLSAGDLDAAELKHAAPGALGKAVQVSVQRIVASVRERERLQAKLTHQAAHDDLTRLPNRAETERLLTKALARCQRSDGRVAVLFVDLDHFKDCNDSLGHAAGDHVLRTAADRMTTVVRPGDTVCRIGGDEFVIVVEPAGTDLSVVEIAQRVSWALAEPIAFGDDAITVGGSVGVAISDSRSDADSLLREADSAMYQAKAMTRGGVEIFNESLRAGLHHDAEFRVAMADALVNGELELHYQPVLDIASGRITTFEALARWRRPDVGMVGPDEFIPMAEKSGLIIDIGQWALRTATAQLVAWTAAHPTFASVKVAVNLSGRHLVQTSVVDDVRAAILASGLEPERLVVEITESVAIDSPAAIDHLHQLSALGVLIALDDFGTGYTSIGQLLHLPVHVLKIDRSLVSGTNEDGTPALERSTRIIDLIVEVAHSLNLRVVAEGVEDRIQLDKLAGAACDSAQGYLFSRPLPAGDVTVWVTAHEEHGRTGTLSASGS
jgi:diguanylate cyclase (GGDEF)-like protein